MQLCPCNRRGRVRGAAVLIVAFALSPAIAHGQTPGGGTMPTPLASRSSQPERGLLKSDPGFTVVQPDATTPISPIYRPSPVASSSLPSDKVLAGLGGGMVGGLLAAWAGAKVQPNCLCQDQGLAGAMVGFGLGTTVGAVLAIKFAR